MVFAAVLVSCKLHVKVSAADSCKSHLKKSFEEYSAKKLGKEYLRMKKGSEKSCEDFGSDFQKIMVAISNKLLKSNADSCGVVRILGAPDATDVPKQYGNFNTGNEKIMVYWWRHWHDFLYFITEDGKIKKASWFYAYE
jgi:hypothetical protein